jgi:hypothetical protein
MVFAMGIHNTEGGSLTGKLPINKLPQQFTNICRKRECFLPHFHQNRPTDRIKRTLLL